jgi:hypothetical protein
MFQESGILLEGVKAQYQKCRSIVESCLHHILPSALQELICDKLQPDLCLLTSLCTVSDVGFTSFSRIDDVGLEIGPKSVFRERIHATRQDDEFLGKRWQIRRIPDYASTCGRLFVREITLDIIGLFRLFMGENHAAQSRLFYTNWSGEKPELLWTLLAGLAQSFELA